MRLEVPDHLQKDFKLLMNLAYDMKQKIPALKRNIKFNEDDGGLFMDVQTRAEGPWRRIGTDQAKQLNTRKRRGPAGFELDELRSMIDGGSDKEAAK